MRACPAFFYGDTKIIFGGLPSAITQYDTSEAGYAQTNKYLNMYLAEGTRISDVKYTTMSYKGFKFPDGSAPGLSETYKFIYDPVGDPSAPYVVAKITESDKYTVDADYFYFANGNDSYTSDASRVIYSDSTTVSSTASGSMLGVKSHWWNRVGEYSITVVGANPCIKYATTAANATSKSGPQLIVGKDLSNPIYEADYELIIGEFDFATDTGEFPIVALKFHGRGSANGNSDSAGLSNFVDGSHGLQILNDGSVKGYGFTLENTVYASTTGWNRLTFVVDATYTDGKYDSAHNYGGKIYFYLNGTLIGVGNRAYIEGAYLFGIRGDISNYQAEGRSILLDNVSMRGYKTVSPSFDFESYVGSEYDMGCALNTEIANDSITVGKVPYADLESAFNAATSMGTLANVNRDIHDAVVSFDGVVSTNGNVIKTTEDSNKAAVFAYPDGSVAAYEFNSKFNGYTVNYHWFNGDITSPDEWLDLDYYVVTELSIGQIPEAPSEIVIPDVVDMDDFGVKYHSGWDFDGDGEGAETLGALTYAQALANKDIYLYPTYDIKKMTAIIEDDSGNIVYYSLSDTLDSSVWSNLKAGTTLKLLSDFVLSGASGFTASQNGGVYNIDFNGHTMFQTKKCTFIAVQNGAILNVYSSVPGGMYYGVELNESTSDNSTLIGTGVFLQLKDTGTESLANASASTYATTINIGTVTVNGKTHLGENLIIAGDCILEPRVGGYNSKINVEGTTLVRPASDYGAMILTRYYYGDLVVKNTTFILASSTLNVYGNHTNGDNALGTATFDSCVFLYRENGENGNLLYRNLGQEYILFTNCVSNGRMNPCKVAGVTQVGEGNAAAVMQFNTKDYLSGVTLEKYGVPMQIPTIATSSYYNPNITDSNTPYISVLDNGIIRMQLWKYSASAGTNGGAVTDGYLYIVPHGYSGSIPKDATQVVEMPILEKITTTQTVTVTYNDLNGNAILSETYAKGGAIYEYPTLSVGSVSVGAIAKVHNGEWDKELPITNIDTDIVINPLFDSKIELVGLKSSMSLYTDFAINLYIPEAYKNAIISVNYGGNALDLTDVSVDGASYVKASVALAADQASDNVVFEISVQENGIDATCSVTTSVADYAESVLTDTDSTDDEIKLVKYMIAYAVTALDYFRGESDARLNAMLAEVDDYTVGEALDTSALAAVFDGARVKLGASLTYEFVVKEGFSGSVNILGREFIIGLDDDRAISVDGLTLVELASDVQIVATDSNGEVVLSSVYNLATYLQYHTANSEISGESEACLALIEALYNYASFASEYSTLLENN